MAKELSDKGYSCAIYRGEMDKTERRANLKKFRDGKVDILVSTDLAGRGLDIENVGRVINYHLPQQMENYLHRAGRTARAGRKGLVVNLVTERDSRLIAKLDGNKPPAFAKKNAPGAKPAVPSKDRFKASFKASGKAPTSAPARGPRNSDKTSTASATKGAPAFDKKADNGSDKKSFRGSSKSFAKSSGSASVRTASGGPVKSAPGGSMKSAPKSAMKSSAKTPTKKFKR